MPFEIVLRWLLLPFAIVPFEIITSYFKGVEATCVEIATVMKKSFKLKDMLNFNVLRNS